MDYVCFSLRLPHPDVDLHPRQPESKENQNKCQTTGKRKGGVEDTNGKLHVSIMIQAGLGLTIT